MHNELYFLSNEVGKGGGGQFEGHGILCEINQKPFVQEIIFIKMIGSVKIKTFLQGCMVTV